MAPFLLGFSGSDMVLLFLILGLLCKLIYQRHRLGKTNELLSLLTLEDSKVILLMLSLAYFWDAYLLSGSGFFVFQSSAFFFSALSLAYMKAFVASLSYLVLVLAESFLFRKGQRMAPEFSIFILIAVFAIFGALQARNLMTMALFMEILSYCLFVMPVLAKITNLSLEALLKYFLLGSLSSAFLLLGTSYIFVTCGTLEYSSLHAIFQLGAEAKLFQGASDLILFPWTYGLFFNGGFICIFSALSFKLGLVPFHHWVRDVYEGSPLPAVAFFATVVKVPSAWIMSKLIFLLVGALGGFAQSYWYFFEAMGLLSISYGTFFAFYQTRIKSLLALSSIINMGYLCLALSLHSFLGFFVAYNYLFTYCFTTLGLFFVLAALTTQRGSLTRLTDVAVVLRAQGFLGWLLAVMLLSAAGMPPLPGFFPKLLVFWAFLINGDWFVAFVLAFTSVANFILYIRLIRFLYFFNLRHGQNLVKDRGDLRPLNKVAVFALLLCFFCSVFFGLAVPIFFWKIIGVAVPLMQV